jgi:hypothetical protein
MRLPNSWAIYKTRAYDRNYTTWAQRLGQHLDSNVCFAHKELLWVLANLTEICRDNIFPVRRAHEIAFGNSLATGMHSACAKFDSILQHIPLPAILACLNSSDFDVRCAAADGGLA